MQPMYFNVETFKIQELIYMAHKNYQNGLLSTCYRFMDLII